MLDEILILGFVALSIYAVIRSIIIVDNLVSIDQDVKWIGVGLLMIVLMLGTFTIGSTIGWIVLEVIYKRAKKKDTKV